MLSISRKICGIHITQIYFLETKSFLNDTSPDLIGITESSKSIMGLKPIETLQKDLTKSVEELFMAISKSTRKQIKQAQKNSTLHKIIVTEPTNEDILLFRDYYNQFAKKKNTYLCGPFNVKTLKLLRDQKALIMTKIEGEDQQPLCYRVYVADGIRAMSLYSASHYRLTDDPKLKRLYGKAHRLLEWEDILWFKNNGYQIYDSGDLTTNKDIRNYKLEFGGEIITRYSGYISYSLKGSMLFNFRKWKFSKKVGG